MIKESSDAARKRFSPCLRGKQKLTAQMQYFFSKKPMRCPDKVTALSLPTHRVAFFRSPLIFLSRVCQNSTNQKTYHQNYSCPVKIMKRFKNNISPDSNISKCKLMAFLNKIKAVFKLILGRNPIIKCLKTALINGGSDKM